MGLFDKLNEIGNAANKRCKELDEEAAFMRNPSAYLNHNNPSMYGGAVKIALTNLINTSDLDQVLKECAPEHSSRLERLEFQSSLVLDKLTELAGRYEELHKQHEELQKNYQQLIQLLTAKESRQR